MNNVCTLVRNIAREQEHKIIKVYQFNVVDNVYIDFYITTKDSFEYYIIIDCDLSNLGDVNNSIQIALSTKLRAHLDRNLDIKNLPFTLSHYFEKNTCIIVTSKVKDEVSSADVYKFISLVEEDSYYFKKQVIYFNDEELSFCDNLILSEDNITEYCGRNISKIDKYEKYILNNDLEYGFLSKLYEKIPFLNLSVTEQDLLNLDDMIKSKLTAEETNLLSQLELLSDEEKIDQWISSLEVEK
ncbi:hypothetical protein GLP30_20085 [Photobacterium phosphoreum]|uniref:Uncharacterized protein n=1 Tax=Photobacterium phosphoreum TaxID=659 RepID=A0AAW4ZXZ2_PHOPO|nr:ABC-three component system middle component 1 [Photobacterium phosphoreum]MCD9493086.1 hypothetical protein [Photobacterium phosphoreum]MCF2192376.1 hypothetical protein [Photobacterium phosphoreum]MCF2304018.1 hypothetical protein [Photobacterium phosphoreum]